MLGQLKNEDVNKVTDSDNKTKEVVFSYRNGIYNFCYLANVRVESLTAHASIHGAEIDVLMKFSMTLILVVFFIVTPMLFYFAYKYRGKKENTAFFLSHNNKLEVIWTVIPTIVLTGVIIFGLKTWDKAMNVDTTGAKVIEVYSEQFKWTKVGRQSIRRIRFSISYK